MNQESNAAKFIEQDKELGLSPDVTMEILNKYATYGANTGIGNLGGNKLVEALNEEYRKRIDEPLNEEPIKANMGSAVLEFFQNFGAGTSDFLKDIFANAPEAAAAPETAAINSPVNTPSDNLGQIDLNIPAPDVPDVNPYPTKLARFEKYLEELANPS